MTDRWFLAPLADLSCRHWAGETVVHHRQSNDTHRLAEPAGWILGRLDAADTLAVDELAADSPYDADDLTPALQALADLGLIQRC
jgi:hypothetical protein